MNSSNIGIKIADGSFYSVLSGTGGKSRRLVLTTVRDNQESVQIDLYKGQGEELEGAQYVGSLMIENIEAASKGDPEVELVLGIDAAGNLNAAAADKSTGEKQSLSVGLTAFDESDAYDMPDFEIEDDIDTSDGVSAEEESRLTTEDFMEEDEEETREEPEYEEPGARKKHPFLLIGFILLGLAVIVIGALLLFKNLQGPEVPPLEAGNGAVVETVEEAPVEEPKEEPPASEPAQPVEEPEVVKAEEPPAAEAPAQDEGVWYTIAWGDTLWDISRAFYKTPWLYPVIAKENSIKNPDYILAETSIYIPIR